ncbi:MAG: hypothetical protein QW727_02195 [Candidatus Pacearchaeota archaeon]
MKLELENILGEKAKWFLRFFGNYEDYNLYEDRGIIEIKRKDNFWGMVIISQDNYFDLCDELRSFEKEYEKEGLFIVLTAKYEREGLAFFVWGDLNNAH